MAETILSASSVAAYQSCGHRFLLQYIELQQGVTSTQAAIGTAVHAGAEAYYRGLIEGGEADPLGTADVAWLLEEPLIAGPDPDIKRPREVVRRVTQAYVEDVAPGIAATMVEQGFLVRVNGIPYSGHLDVADDAVHDTKVLGSRPRYPDKYRFAATGYVLGHRVLTGRDTSRFVLDVMIRLVRDRPRHEPIVFEIGEADEATFAEGLESVAEGVAAGRFPPSGLSTGECRWCPVRYLCSYYMEA